jgi:hypothetical protein
MDGIRAKESPTKDVYLNVNDLIIELMRELEKANNDSERNAIKRVIARLTHIRDASHGRTSGI